jgi:predicted ATP-dependent endonuclease of OLD family
MPDIKRKSMEWQQNAGLLKHKTSDYQNRIAQMQDSYSNIEAEIIIAKEMLVKSKALEDLKIKVVEESSNLSSYKNLPAVIWDSVSGVLLLGCYTCKS